MTRRGFAGALAGTAALLASACSPLTLFNRFAPRDPARQPGQGLAYGADPRQRLDLYAPEGGGMGLPVLVFFYGGGWNSGRRQDYAWVGHSLAAQGFLVIVPDYRLAPAHPYPDFVQDGAAAVRWALDHAAAYGGDPDRLAISGHSAGAYIALQLAMDQAFLQAAGVDPRRVRAVAGLSGPYDFYPFVSPLAVEAFGRWPDPKATQPINHVGPGRPPAFLAHGDADTLVELSNTYNLSKALRAAGDEVETKIYPGVDHPGMILALSPAFRGKAPVLADMTSFLTRHLA
ncbi:MAG TPA: alpha/beta hydrolase [Caulobacteraceae bacterium]|nr:alpha/beta hydrolase [Caulobacteraceae bacterium]